MGKIAVVGDVVADEVRDVEIEAVFMAGRVRMRNDGGRVVVAGRFRSIFIASMMVANQRRGRFTS